MGGREWLECGAVAARKGGGRVVDGRVVFSLIGRGRVVVGREWLMTYALKNLYY